MRSLDLRWLGVVTLVATCSACGPSRAPDDPDAEYPLAKLDAGDFAVDAAVDVELTDAGDFAADAALDVGVPDAGDFPADAATDAGLPDAAEPEPDFAKLSTGACTSDGWCWENPIPAGGEFYRVWPVGPNDVWVGGSLGALGMLIHWDGETWSAPWPLAQSPCLAFTGIWGSSSNDVWAVGPESAVGGLQGSGSCLVHWDGVALSVSPSISPQSTLGVWGSSGSEVLAVGSAGTNLRWDGTQWSLRPPLSTTGSVFGVWGSAPNDVWAAGDDGFLARWNGSSWAQVTSSSTAGFFDVWGTGAGDVWAVDKAGGIEHFDGTNWTSSPSGTTQMIQGVWASSPTNAWAAAGKSMLHWDGASWNAVPPLISESQNHVGVRGSSPSDVWAVGGFGSIQRWDGSSWKRIDRNAVPDRGTSIKCVWGDASGEGWAVGDDGGVGRLFRRAGASWVEVPAPANLASKYPTICRLWGSGPADVWIIWDAKTFHYDGVAWTQRVDLPSALTPNAIWGSAANDLWMIGESSFSVGAIAHWDGATWSSATIPKVGRLLGVWGSGPSDVWAVGQSGTILHWNGSSWSRVSAPTSAMLAGISGTSATDVWAGGSGIILHWDGTEWSTSPTRGVSGDLLAAVHPDEVWAWGASEYSLSRWDGSSWTTAYRNYGGVLPNWVSVTDSDAWIGGADGAILHKRR